MVASAMITLITFNGVLDVIARLDQEFAKTHANDENIIQLQEKSQLLNFSGGGTLQNTKQIFFQTFKPKIEDSYPVIQSDEISSTSVKQSTYQDYIQNVGRTFFQDNQFLTKRDNRRILVTCPTWQTEYKGVCYDCLPQCLKCNGIKCTACDTTYYNSLAKDNCTLKSGAPSIPCHYSCQTCAGTRSNQCITCSSNRAKPQYQQVCVCPTGYYDNGVNAACVKCLYSCQACSNSLQCASCDFWVKKRILSGSSCVCLTGYYDDGSNQQCKACHYSCATCTNSSSCLTCKTGRTQLSKPSVCVCPDKYYETILATCLSCSSTCKTCSKTAKTCTSCISAANLKGTQCVCIQGQFDSKGQCSSCSYTCLTCTTVSTQCLTCSSSDHRTLQAKTCPCDVGYYDEGDSLCESCDYRCSACLNSTVCTSCSSQSLRSLVNQTCVCPQGYYDNQTELCLKCDQKCQTCDQDSTQCLSCFDSQLRSYNSSTNSCVCYDGYFDANQAICQTCSITCSTCDIEINNCTSCNQSNFRMLMISSCICQDGYYEQNIAMCGQCDANCHTCYQVSTNCTSCISAQQKILAVNSCVCDQGFYEDSNTTCQPCSQKCLTCVNNPKTCLSCATNSSRVLINSTCVCDQGYYDKNGTCLKCDSTCLECSQQKICTKCDINQNRTLSRNSCVCLEGFSQNNKTGKCLANPRVPIGKSCGLNEVVVYNLCECVQGYYLLQNKCQLVKQHCQQTGCLFCENNTCQKCFDGYYQQNQTCFQCDERCSTCNGPLVKDCQSCKYIKSISTCSYCEDIPGLFTQGYECQHRCGDGIVYPLKEQCDDGNQLNEDGCNNTCHLTPTYQNAYIRFYQNYSLFSSIRVVHLYFSSQQIPPSVDYTKWKISISNNFNAKLKLWDDGHQIYFRLLFNQSMNNLKLYVEIDNQQQFIVQNLLVADIPPFRLVTAADKKNAESTMSTNDFFLYIILIIMVSCLLTGGFDMIFNIMDLFQLISYLKYLNIAFPYNVQVYFDFMGQFNFQFISRLIPGLNFGTLLSEDYHNSEFEAPEKISEDGYVTLFLINSIPLIIVLTINTFTYLLCRLFYQLLRKVYSLANVDLNNDFHSQTKQIQKIRIIRTFISTIETFTESFFWGGVYRIYMQTAYDLNFAVFLELSRLHLSSSSFVSWISSGLGLSFLYFQIHLLAKISLDLAIGGGNQINSKYVQDKVSVFSEGLQIKKDGIIRYYTVIFTFKKILFMGVLILLYHQPFIQIGVISLIHLGMSFMVFIIKPFESDSDYYKTFSCDLAIAVFSLLFLVLYINTDIQNLTDRDELTVGWLIISCLLLCLCVEIYFDIKENIKNLRKAYLKVKKYLARRQRRLRRRLAFLMRKRLLAAQFTSHLTSKQLPN